MKRIFSLLVLGTFLCGAAILAAAKSGDSKTWTGWISDSGCGAKGAKAAHKQCAATCVKEKGAKWVLVDSQSKQVLAIHNQDAVKDDDVGQEVKVTGDVMEDKSIHVESISPAS